MNPCANNLLDDTPATHPRLISNHQQHNTSSPFGGAAAVDPYTSHLNVPQTHLNNGNFQQHNTSSLFGGAAAMDPYTSGSHMSHSRLNDALQTGFPNALHFPASNNESLEDVSTWKLDTIREVATDIYRNLDLALFDLQDKYNPTTPETSPPVCGWNNNVGADEYDEDDVVGAYGGVDLDHEPLYADPSGGNHSPLPSGSAGPRPRKQKMHEWPPQSDPEKEKRRKRAVRQKRQRQKEQQEIQQLHKDLEDTRREVAELIPEANLLRRRVQMLEQYAAQQGCSGELLENY